MAIIQVTPEMLQQQAAELRQLNGEHEAVYQKMVSLVNALNQQWKGEAQAAFLSNYQSMAPTFKKFSETTEGFAKLMETAARELQSTDQTLKGRMMQTF